MGWEDLEKKVKHWLSVDNAMTVPGSGNGKGEEDVIGIGTITQCKYTGKKNTSILSKDVNRLIDAGKMLDKFPIFVTENSDGIMVSIPECKEIVEILEFIAVIKQLDQIQNEIRNCNNQEILEKLDVQFEKIRQKAERINSRFRDKINKLIKVITTKYNNLITCNLFEDINETKERSERSETESSCSEQEVS